MRRRNKGFQHGRSKQKVQYGAVEPEGGLVHDLSVRPLEAARLKGTVDAICTQSKYFQHLQEATGKIRAIEDILNVEMVPELAPQNLAAIEIGKDFMRSHGYIKNDFDVQEWAAPEFLQQAAKDLLEERWNIVTAAKLPAATSLRLG